MTLQHALADLFGGDTQTTIAARLAGAGLAVDQTKVSRWLRGATDPRLAELPTIEDAYGKPRGWILARAGFVEMPGVEPVKQPDAPSATLEQRVTAVEGQLRELLTLVQVKALAAEGVELAAVESSRPKRRARRA